MNSTLIANVGIPMIFIQVPTMMYVLIPIILIEFLVLRHTLHLSSWKTLYSVTLANLYSTLIAIPTTWLGLLAGQMLLSIPLQIMLSGQESDEVVMSPVWIILIFLITIPWLYPIDQLEQHIYWMVPMALLILLIPSFFASLSSEQKVYKTLWKKLDSAALKHGVFKANVLSYLLLFTLGMIWLFKALYTKELLYLTTQG